MGFKSVKCGEIHREFMVPTTGQLPLDCDRILVRYFDRDRDADEFFSYRNDQEIARYQGWPYPFTPRHLEEFFTEMELRTLESRGSWVQLAVEHKETGQLIGDVAFSSDGKTAEVGITVRTQYQRQGYAREAMEALLSLLFSVLNLHRVVAVIDVDNSGSIALFSSLGFRKEAHYIKSYWDSNTEQWRDEYSYALLSDEFRAK